jgi:UDP-N-acetylglucosamine 2-epimerase (non-hydrolysing)
VRIILLAGARPNLIKVAPLLPAFAEAGVNAEVAFTGPREWGVPTEDPERLSFWGVTVPAPKWFLDIAEGTSAFETGAALLSVERLLASERPDAVLAVGDHNATLAIAIAAAKQRIPVAHLEAGLRCGDLGVPEEVNRVLISRVTALHLASDESSIAHLMAEGVDSDRIVLVGSVLAESVIRNGEQVRKLDVAARYGFEKGTYVVASFHCAENLENPLRCQYIFDGLAALGMPVILPDAHGALGALETYGIRVAGTVHIVGAAPYPEMLALLRDAAAIVTDSGGVQEEACVLGTPCVTVRRCTERVATIEVGANRLADATREALVAAVADAIEGPRKWLTPKRWDKAVSQRVIRALRRGVPPLA